MKVDCLTTGTITDNDGIHATVECTMIDSSFSVYRFVVTGRVDDSPFTEVAKNTTQELCKGLFVGRGILASDREREQIQDEVLRSLMQTAIHQVCLK